MLLLQAVLVITFTFSSSSSASSLLVHAASDGFNYEIEKRVHERVTELMNIPVKMLGLVERYALTNVFEPPFLRPHQRDELFRFLWTVWSEFNHVDLYYGQEDGLFLGLIKGSGTYQEGRGTNGYRVDVVPQSTEEENNVNATIATTNSNDKKNGIVTFITEEDQYMKRLYYDQCLNRTSGEPERCDMDVNEDYIECYENCILTPCDGTNIVGGGKESSSSSEGEPKIWCPTYVVKKVPPPNTIYISTTTIATTVATSTPMMMGYVPRYYYCLNDSGQFIENDPPNSVESPKSIMKNGVCTHTDGKTLVEGRTSKPDTYAFCHRDNYQFLQKQLQEQQQHHHHHQTLPSTLVASVSKNDGDENDEDDPTKCDTPFIGGYHSRRYEPRLRPWYIGTRDIQNSFWTKPYPFATNNDMGISFGKPIYYMDPYTNRKVFRGVICVDYDLEEISKFLRTIFLEILTEEEEEAIDNDNKQQQQQQEDEEGSGSGSSSSSSGGATVLIVEDDEPHYIIGSSTGSRATKKVRVDDETIDCDDAEIFMGEQECKTVRSTPKDIFSKKDVVMSSAFEAQKLAGFPKRLVVSSSSSTLGIDEDEDNDDNENNENENDNNDNNPEYYVSQSLIYEQSEGENLRWRIIVAMPVKMAMNDSLVWGEPMFVVVLAVSVIGFFACLGLFYYYFSKRTIFEIAMSDWRFTSAFIVGCALLNLSSLTTLGPVSNWICMLRMWSFHICFVLALSPLLVKVWRMYRLVGSADRARRLSITNQKAMLYTLPAILLQVFILTLFSIFDPALKYTYVDIDGSSSSQHRICKHDSNAFSITEIIFEGGLVFVGCVLAYKTRNMCSTLGEAKQLLFAMYNVALVALIVILMGYFLTIDQQSVYVIMTVGVFWATVFSSCAFVLPRLLQVKRRRGRSVSGRGSYTFGTGESTMNLFSPSRDASTSSLVGSNHTNRSFFTSNSFKSKRSRKISNASNASSRDSDISSDDEEYQIEIKIPAQVLEHQPSSNGGSSSGRGACGSGITNNDKSILPKMSDIFDDHQGRSASSSSGTDDVDFYSCDDDANLSIDGDDDNNKRGKDDEKRTSMMEKDHHQDVQENDGTSCTNSTQEIDLEAAILREDP